MPSYSQGLVIGKRPYVHGVLRATPRMVTLRRRRLATPDGAGATLAACRSPHLLRQLAAHSGPGLGSHTGLPSHGTSPALRPPRPAPHRSLTRYARHRNSLAKYVIVGSAAGEECPNTSSGATLALDCRLTPGSQGSPTDRCVLRSPSSDVSASLGTSCPPRPPGAAYVRIAIARFRRLPGRWR